MHQVSSSYEKMDRNIEEATQRFNRNTGKCKTLVLGCFRAVLLAKNNPPSLIVVLFHHNLSTND